jgi:hypothetical protein
MHPLIQQLMQLMEPSGQQFQAAPAMAPRPQPHDLEGLDQMPQIRRPMPAPNYGGNPFGGGRSML